MSDAKLKTLSELVSLCQRRGFVFPSSEIYGGLNSCWDYGPLGVQLKNNIKKHWWEGMTRRHNVTGLDSSIFMHPRVWEASGHLKEFTDPLQDCRDCKQRFCPKENITHCPKCGSSNLTETRNFNLMFKSFMGPVEEKSSVVYLRPETAQGIYVNFLNVQKSLRYKLPFGIAQIGKAFRNEITPSHFIFRMREFEQMEMQFFIPPTEGDKWFNYWKQERQQALLDLGLKSTELHFVSHPPEKLAHYAKAAQDIEYDFIMGRKELEGLHYRGDFDLSCHQKHSGKNLKYFDEKSNSSYIPHIIETSVGCDRLFLACLCSAYTKETLNNDATNTNSTREVLKLKPQLAPIQAALLPLSKKPELLNMGHKIQQKLQKKYFIDYDLSGSIGKRYRRQDEIGTPFCLTIDFESLKDHCITLRDRDTMKQKRILISDIETILKKELE